MEWKYLCTKLMFSTIKNIIHTQMLMALPLIVLYEGCILLVWFNEKRGAVG